MKLIAKIKKIKKLLLIIVWGSIFTIGFIFILLSNHLIHIRNYCDFNYKTIL